MDKLKAKVLGKLVEAGEVGISLSENFLVMRVEEGKTIRAYLGEKYITDMFCAMLDGVTASENITEHGGKAVEPVKNCIPKRYSLILYYLPGEPIARIRAIKQVAWLMGSSEEGIERLYKVGDIELLTGSDYDYIKSVALDFMAIGCGCHIKVKDEG